MRSVPAYDDVKSPQWSDMEAFNENVDFDLSDDPACAAVYVTMDAHSFIDLDMCVQSNKCKPFCMSVKLSFPTRGFFNIKNTGGIVT